MKCACEKLNGYFIKKCVGHIKKRKTIFQLYKELKKENNRLKNNGNK